MSTVTQSSTLEAERFETQARLARRSLEQRPFSRLHHLLRWNVWIDLSIERVLRNKGSHTPGVDNKTKKEYAKSEAKQKLREDVKQVLRMYSSSPVRRIFIPKNHKPHETRPLGIPTIVDRAAQDHAPEQRVVGDLRGKNFKLGVKLRLHQGESLGSWVEY